MAFFSKQNKHFVFPMKTHQTAEEQIFVMKNFYYGQIKIDQLTTLLRFMSQVMNSSTKRTSEILKVFDVLQ